MSVFGLDRYVSFQSLLFECYIILSQQPIVIQPPLRAIYEYHFSRPDSSCKDFVTLNVTLLLHFTK